MSKERILLVDDDPNILEVLCMRLESKGFEPFKVKSTEQALSRLKQERYDLVLTDLRMTGLDGMDLLEEIRRMDPELPVIILTAHGSIPNAVEAM